MFAEYSALLKTWTEYCFDKELYNCKIRPYNNLHIST